MSASSDLMAVVQDLCLVASAWLLRGRLTRSQLLIDQSTELLAHRGRLIAYELLNASAETVDPGSPEPEARGGRCPN